MKKRIALFLALLLALTAFAACGGGSAPAQSAAPAAAAAAAPAAPAAPAAEEAPAEPAAAGEYVIHYPTHQIGSNSSAPANAEMVRTFNEKFAGQYRIQVEEVPGDANYLDKMKILASANDLPDFVYASELVDIIYAQGSYLRLNEALDADPEWKALFPETVIAHNTRDGNVVGLPNEGQMIGYFYNKEHFETAGITPATTWEEFFDNCAKLKAAGITPMSMQTGDNGWVSMLFLSQMIASNGGADFMNQAERHTDYNQPYVIDSLNMVQRIWNEGYTTMNSVGGMYEDAANNFISGNTAMIANGTWMISSFADPAMGGSEEFASKVGIAIYPGGTYISNPFDGFMVCAQTDEGKAAGLEMLKHWTSAETQLSNLRAAGLMPSASIEIPQDVIDANPLMGQLLVDAKSASGNKSLSNLWRPSVPDVFSAQFTLFAEQGCTAEELAAAITEAAAQA